MAWLSNKAQNNATVAVETGSKIGPYFDWDKGKIGVNIPIPNLRGGFANKDFNIDFSGERAKGDFRSTMQGTTMALADEIEANVRSVFSSKPKAEILTSIRDQIKKFKSENPKAAISNEILGNMLTGTLGIGKNIVTTILRSAGLGGVYGFNRGDPGQNNPEIPLNEAIKERASGAIIPAILSGTLGAVGKYLSPSPAAEKLIEKGINPSPLQAIGKSGQQLEQVAAKSLIYGPGFAKAIEASQKSYSVGVLSDIINQINKATGFNYKNLENFRGKLKDLWKAPLKNLPKNDANRANSYFNKIVSNAYSKVTSPLIIKNRAGFLKEIINVVKKNTPYITANKEELKVMENIVRKQIFSRFKQVKVADKNGNITQVWAIKGNDIKTVHSDIRNIAVSGNKSNTVPKERIDFGNELEKVFSKALVTNNAPKLVEKYNNLDRVYPNIKAFKDAAVKSQKTEFPGVVTPYGLQDTGVATALKRGQQRKVSEGIYPNVAVAQQGVNVIGRPNLNNLVPGIALGVGTTGAIAAGALQNPTATSVITGLGLTAYNTPWGRNLLSNALKKKIISRTAPSGSNVIDEEFVGM